MSGTVLGACDTSVNKTGKEPSCHGAYIGGAVEGLLLGMKTRKNKHRI